MFSTHFRRGGSLLRVGLALAAGWIGPVMAEEGRATWKNTRLIGAPGKPSEMTAVRAYPRLPVRRPVAIEREPGTNRLLVLENLAWDEYKSSLKRFVDDPEAGELETVCAFTRVLRKTDTFTSGRMASGPGSSIIPASFATRFRVRLHGG